MARTERAVLAGGCFWGMQQLIRRQPGVISTRVGYSGGDVPNATYRNHGTHAEAIEIIFDPDVTSFRKIRGSIRLPMNLAAPSNISTFAPFWCQLQGSSFGPQFV